MLASVLPVHVAPNATTSAQPAPPSSADAWPTETAWHTVGPLPGTSAEPQKQKARSDTGQSGFSMVGLTGFEPATT